jgi:hypothetical protein
MRCPKAGALLRARARTCGADGGENHPGMMVSVFRIAIISLILVALAAGGVTLALAGSGPATAPITRVEADAFAHLVNLKASDLPGATALKGAIFGPEAVQYEALKCGHQGKPGIAPIGGGELWLVNSRARVGSIVAVAPSDYIAEAEIAGLDSPGGRTCLARALGRALAFEQHNQVEQSHTVRVTFVPAAKLPGGAIAVQVLARLPPIEGVKLKARYINVDASFFREGPAAVALFVLGATRFPPATEDHLLALLHSRAEAHKL